jgi:hypothetical protein
MGRFGHDVIMSPLFSSSSSKSILTPRILCGLLLLSGAACAVMAEDPPETEPVGSAPSPSKVMDDGTVLSSGLNLPSGYALGNGQTLTNGFNLSNGTGGGNPNGINIPGGTIAPPSGSDLEKWIDVSPTTRKRALKYLVQAALSTTQSVTLTYRGTSATYQGVFNHGPGWATGSMTTAEQEKVSASLLARVNQSGAVVAIDLVGPNSSFGTGWNTRSSADHTNYPQVEAAFAGNLFLYPSKVFTCGAGPFSDVAATSPHTAQMCDTRMCDGAASCTTSSCWSNGPNGWECLGTCNGTFKFDTNCYVNCSQSGTYPNAGGTDPYFYACSDANNSTTWTHVMTSYIKQYGYDHVCSGHWECISGLCEIPWYGGTVKHCN